MTHNVRRLQFHAAKDNGRPQLHNVLNNCHLAFGEERSIMLLISVFVTLGFVAAEEIDTFLK